MRATSNSRLLDAATTLSSVALIIAGMAIIDENVRRFLASIVRGDLQVSAIMPDVRLQPIMRSFTDVVGRDHSQVAAFAFAGFVLFVSMFRM
jgi:hypothetical protein